MSNLHIIQWNCRGLRTNLDNLKVLITEYKPAVICLQETKLKSGITVNVRGYSEYHHYCTDHERASGGSSVLVNNAYLHRKLDINTNLQIQAIRCTLGNPITICSVYIPPSQSISNYDIENIIMQLPKPFVLLGDFNAHNPIWGSKGINQRGKTLENQLVKSAICLYNDNTPTHIDPSNLSTSQLDLSFCDPSIYPNFSWKVHDSLLGSDHFPTILQKNITHSTSHTQHWNFTRADWKTFQTECINELNSNKINTIEMFENTLLSIANQSIPKTSARPRRDKPWFPRVGRGI